MNFNPSLSRVALNAEREHERSAYSFAKLARDPSGLCRGGRDEDRKKFTEVAFNNNLGERPESMTSRGTVN